MNHGKINHRIYRSYFSVVGCLCVGSKAVVDLGKRKNTKERSIDGRSQEKSLSTLIEQVQTGF